MKKSKYLLMLIIAMTLYGTIGVFRRYIPISSAQLAFFRGIIGSITLYIWIKANKKSFSKISKTNLILLILSGALMGFNWMLLFEAYNYTSVATATLCYYMEPVMLIIFSCFLFKENISYKQIICILIALIGMVFVSGILDTSIQINDSKGILYGLLAAFLYTCVVLMNKKINNIDTYEKTILQLLSASISLVPYILINETITISSIDLLSLSMILIVGIVHTGIAYALYFGAIPYLNSTSLALFSYIDPVVAILLSITLLNESISLLGIIGAILILGSTIVSEFSKK